ncbi:hypothetical protein [Streptomyces sp. NBC_00316]|uniref:hypothetical protein n=1 Tax=Streptomyces sp. NBC_00316 TaxID=2975710 RepID=UPI002E2D8F84|nr:hypothetical protein [Streptomyces sp. NBC_00316]
MAAVHQPGRRWRRYGATALTPALVAVSPLISGAVFLDLDFRLAEQTVPGAVTVPAGFALGRHDSVLDRPKAAAVEQRDEEMTRAEFAGPSRRLNHGTHSDSRRPPLIRGGCRLLYAINMGRRDGTAVAEPSPRRGELCGGTH